MRSIGNNKTRNVLARIAGVVLTAGFCLSMSTGMIMPVQEEEAPPVPVIAEIPGPPPTPTPTPTPEPEFFELSFVGDCTLASVTYNKSLSISYESLVGDDYAYPFAQTAEFFLEDDFTFANLECVLSDHTQASDKNFVFRADPAYVNILTEGNVEFVTLGNNHVLDFGEQGYADTKATLDGAGISYAGRDEWSIYETASGLKIGVYALSFGTTQQIKAGVADCRNAGADFVIAALHWGDEGSYDVTDLQRNQGHAAIDAGADFVYGSHTHTLQEFEEYNGKYIYYSLGNWSFGGNTSPRDIDTVILKLSVMRDIDGSITVTERRHIPCACTGAPGNNYQPVPYAEDSEGYARVISKLEGTFSGPNLNVNYEYNFNEY